MDTKSRKFSRTLPVRIVAVLLLAALVMTNSFFLAKAARGIIIFGAPYVTQEQEPVSKTNAFAATTMRLILNLAWRVSESNEADSNYVEQKKAALAEKYADSIALYNEIIADYNACVVEQGSDDANSRQESVTFVASTVPDSETAPSAVQATASSPYILTTVTPLETFTYSETVTGYDNYNAFYEAEHTVTVKRGEKGFWYQQYINSGFADITSFAYNHANGYSSYVNQLENISNGGNSIEDIDRYLKGIASARYFIIDKQTGTYFTNIASCTTSAQASDALRGSKWYAFYGADGSFESSDKRDYYPEETGNLNYISAFTFSRNAGTRQMPMPMADGSLMPASPYYWLYSVQWTADYPVGDYDMYIAIDTAWANGKEDDPFVAIEREYSAGQLGVRDLAAILVTFLAYIIVIVYLLAVTGKGDGDERKKYVIDRLWNDLHFVISLGLCFGLGTLAILLVDNMWGMVLFNPFALSLSCSVIMTAVVLLLVEWLSSVVRHAACRTYLRTTLIYKLLGIGRSIVMFCLRPIINFFKRLYGQKDVKSLPRFTGLVVIGFVCFHLLITSFAVAAHSLFFSFIVFLLDAAAVSVLLWVILSLDKIMQTVEQAKNGNPHAMTNTKSIFPLLKKLATDVNSVNDGVQKAVDSAIKGQRMKAELITNVSHDLKTPLTSIVSYVDLLKRCDVQDEQAKKYIDILDDKSQRMKKLIEDLVEASKASSGNVELNPMKLNICELAAQAVGENSELLEENGIEVRFNPPQEPVFITADGQKTSRIIENLFSNVRKYAMPDTRVYVDIARDDKYGALVIKNISRNPIDVPASELTARFVRGDSSRTSEGSGLGLSIAQNLCELQGGKFVVWVDGDLFKVTVFLPLAE